jgi:hypothetical protein
MPTQTQKPKKVGRPKLPKGEAKGRYVAVRFDADDLRLVTAASKAAKQNLSEWIRDSLRAAAEVYLFRRTLHEAMQIVLSEHPEQKADTRQLSEEIERRSLYFRKDGDSATASQINARARKYLSLFTFTDPNTIQLSSSERMTNRPPMQQPPALTTNS